MEKKKSFVTGLLAALAGCLPGVAAAQERGLGEAMRARMQARIEAQQRDDIHPERERTFRAADNGAWQRPEAQQRGEWHRADRGTRPDAGARDGDPIPDRDRGERGPDRPRGERGQRPDWRGDGGQAVPDRSPRVERDGRRLDRTGRERDRRGRDWDPRGRDRASWRYQRARDERAWYDRSDFEERRDWNWRSDDARQWVRGGWDRGWRQSSRYNWNGYRASNRAAYRLPRYYAPGEWAGGYRRFSLGARLSLPLFAERYWIEDPYAYRLPEAYGPYRWVRFYNDALLVDLDTGEVVDAVHDIFW